MNNTLEVKNKLLTTIKEIVLSNPEIEIPRAVENCILESYGWTIDEKYSSENELNDFVQVIEEWIGIVRSTKNHKKCIMEDKVESGLSEAFEKYLDAELEYVNVTSTLVQALQTASKCKEKYSEEFNRKCQIQKSNMDLLSRKVLGLKMQCFSKLYGENNAVKAHVKLRDSLNEELQFLTKSYDEAIALNSQFDEIKMNKKFIELSKLYKELKKIEKRIIIIGDM